MAGWEPWTSLIYQHGILPKILWPLLVYAVPISTVEILEEEGQQLPQKMVGAAKEPEQHRTLWPQLPFKSLGEEFKVTRAREVVQYRDSSDLLVANAGIQVRTGIK